MELEQLRQLECIADLGTFSAAAKALHISQPALSRSMQRLEADLGVSLFERVGKRSSLSPTGVAASSASGPCRQLFEWARQA